MSTQTPTVAAPDRGVHGRPPRGFSNAAPRATERRVVGAVMRRIGSPPLTIELWDGATAWACDGTATGTLRFADRGALWSFLAHPPRGFAEGYAAGTITVEGDLVQVVTDALRALEGAHRGDPAFVGFPLRVTGLRRARANALQHYDLGNDFYGLWLDSRMVYTCAYFEKPELSLDQAQLAKLDYVCRKLDLQPGERVIEAGCGWGAWALHAAAHYGVSVRAFNVSPEQTAYARERAQALGLADRVEFIEDDYRNITGNCDAFVSIGMLEHVGLRSYPDLRGIINRTLTPSGRGLLHFIGRVRARPMDPWFESRVFPGAFFPSLSQMLEVLEPADLAVLDVENLRLHYAKTVQMWLDRFDAQADAVETMFDPTFVRHWRMYLAGATAAFRAGTCQLYQVVFARAGRDDIAGTRARLYRGHGETAP